MDVIFELKNEPEWANEINDDKKASFPEYYATNPLIGSEAWWESINEDVINGKITHVGNFIEDGEVVDIVSILPLDEDFNGDGAYSVGQPEFSVLREDFWLNDVVKPEALVQIKSVTVRPTGELDEHSVYIETQVGVS